MSTFVLSKPRWVETAVCSMLHSRFHRVWRTCLACVCALGLGLACTVDVRAADEKKPSAGDSAAPDAEKQPDAEKKDEHKSHAGGHHDETDLGHANAGPKLEDPAEIRYDLAIYTLVVFLLLMGLLWKFAWGPICSALDKREQNIADQIEQAEQSAKKAADSLAAYEAKLATAADETREMLASARRDADAAKEKIVAEAQQQAEQVKNRAIAEIETAKNIALDEVASQGADIAVNLAGQIVKRELNADDHATLIRDSLAKFPSNN